MGLIVSQVLQEYVGCKLCERCCENVRLEFEKLIDHVCVLNVVKDVSGQSNYIFKRLV